MILTLPAIAKYHICSLRRLIKTHNVSEIKLPITIVICYPFILRCRKTRTQCRPVTHIFRVAHEPDMAILGGTCLYDLRSIIRTAIIHHDELIIFEAKSSKHLTAVLQKPRQSLRLVISRKKDT